MDRIAVGNFLSELRNEKDITQEQLAEHLNVSSKTISKWECGNSMPDLETLVKLAEFYDVSLYELINGKKVKNIFISKKDLRKVINKNSLTKIMITKISSLILAMAILILMAVCTVYAFNNYDKFRIYEMISADNEFYIDGMLVKNRGNYYLAISKIDYDYAKTEKEFLDDKTKQIKYYIAMDDKFLGDIKFKNFDNFTTIRDALPLVRFYVSNKPIKSDMNKFDLCIQYKNNKGENITKTFKIILVKKHSNDKVIY